MNYSIQLYTLRESLAADPAGTLARLAGMGLSMVEPHRFVDNAAEFADLLAANGLHAPSAHTRFLGEEQDRIFAAAARIGVKTLVQPVSDKSLWRSVAGIEALAADLNDATRRAGEYGLSVGYHNHGFEYDGGVSSPLERLARLLLPEVVLELDTYWVATRGDDPVRLIHALGEQVALLHLKDGPISLESRDQVALGDGAMPVADIVAAAPGALGVIELDDCRTDMFVAVERSLRYLKGLS